MSFIEHLDEVKARKDTILCIGLDPALPNQRTSNTIPHTYDVKGDVNDTRLRFCLDIIHMTKEFCCAYKPNQQYVAGFTRADHQTLTTAIHDAHAVAILDYKLNDIGSSMESALFHIHHWGYDAITFNPYLGNLDQIVDIAHGYNPQIGIFVLTLTSNPAAVRYQKTATIKNVPLFQVVAQDVRQAAADGCVIGATRHVTEADLRTVRSIVGPDIVFLVPGIGAQRGDLRKILRAAGKKVLINVGRDIIYSDAPAQRAEDYYTLLHKTREGRTS